MNCQPSFRTGSVPIVVPPLGGLGRWAFDAHDGGARGEEAAEPWRGPPRRRVPDCDIIEVGARVPARRGDPIDVRDLALGAAPPAPLGRRNYTKPLLVLLILQIAIAGGLHLRKRLAEASVIVVPATADGRTVIT